jgi:hypothetical protein
VTLLLNIPRGLAVEDNGIEILVDLIYHHHLHGLMHQMAQLILLQVLIHRLALSIHYKEVKSIRLTFLSPN